MISVVMPTYLGAYPRSGRNREGKLPRAIQIVLDMQGYFAGKRVRMVYIDKQAMFSGIPRNVGIDNATGEWICYLDNDDVLGPNHLEQISQGMIPEVDWLFFDDWVLKEGGFRERHCEIKAYQCGTSNIAHRRSMRSRWEISNKYGSDDLTFIRKLKNESTRWKRVQGEYLVCHIPLGNKYDI